MLKRNLTAVISTLLLAGLTSGCITSSDRSNAPEMQVMTATERDDNARRVSEEYMASFQQAFRNNDYERFKSIISPEAQKTLTPEAFQEMRRTSIEEQGNLLHAELLTTLDKILYQTFVWKMIYAKEDSEGNQSRKEYLFYIQVGKTGEDQYSIGAAGFCL